MPYPIKDRFGPICSSHVRACASNGRDVRAICQLAETGSDMVEMFEPFANWPCTFKHLAEPCSRKDRDMIIWPTVVLAKTETRPRWAGLVCPGHAGASVSGPVAQGTRNRGPVSEPKWVTRLASVCVTILKVLELKVRVRGVARASTCSSQKAWSIKIQFPFVCAKVGRW